MWKVLLKFFACHVHILGSWILSLRFLVEFYSHEWGACVTPPKESSTPPKLSPRQISPEAMKMKLIPREWQRRWLDDDTSDDNNNRSDYTARTDVLALEVDWLWLGRWAWQRQRHQVLSSHPAPNQSLVAYFLTQQEKQSGGLCWVGG